MFLQENAALMFSVHGVLGSTHSVYGLCCTICRLLRALGCALYFFVDFSNNWNGKGSIQKSVSIFVFCSFLWDILLCCIVAFWNLTVSGRGCNILIFMCLLQYSDLHVWSILFQIMLHAYSVWTQEALVSLPISNVMKNLYRFFFAPRRHWGGLQQVAWFGLSVGCC